MIVDQQAIFQTSKVGEDVERQLQAFKQSEQAEFAAPAKELREEQEALQLQLPTLAPDVLEKKIAAFRAKQMDLRQKVQIRQDMLQGGDMNAREQVEQALAPIVQDIMRERGANLVLQKSSVVQSAGDVDITATVIQRLDRKLSGLKVKFVATPGNMTMMQ